MKSPAVILAAALAAQATATAAVPTQREARSTGSVMVQVAPTGRCQDDRRKRPDGWHRVVAGLDECHAACTNAGACIGTDYNIKTSKCFVLVLDGAATPALVGWKFWTSAKQRGTGITGTNGMRNWRCHAKRITADAPGPSPAPELIASPAPASVGPFGKVADRGPQQYVAAVGSFVSASSISDCAARCQGRGTECSSFTFYSLGDYGGKNCKLMSAALDGATAWATSTRDIVMHHYTLSAPPPPTSFQAPAAVGSFGLVAGKSVKQYTLTVGTFVAASSLEDCAATCASTGRLSFTYYSLGDYQGKNCKLMALAIGGDSAWGTSSRDVAMHHYTLPAATPGATGPLTSSDTVKIIDVDGQMRLDVSTNGYWTEQTDWMQHTAVVHNDPAFVQDMYVSYTLRKSGDYSSTGCADGCDVLPGESFGIYPHQLIPSYGAERHNWFGIRMDLMKSGSPSGPQDETNFTSLKIVPCDGSTTIQYGECVRILSADGIYMLNIHRPGLVTGRPMFSPITNRDGVPSGPYQEFTATRT